MLAACINFDIFLRKEFVCADIIFRNLATEGEAVLVRNCRLMSPYKGRLIRNGIPIQCFSYIESKCPYREYLLTVCTTLAVPKTAPIKRKTSKIRYIFNM